MVKERPRHLEGFDILILSVSQVFGDSTNYFKGLLLRKIAPIFGGVLHLL